MNVVGWIFLLLIVAVVLAGVAVAVGSIPDIRRYSRIRRM